MIFNPKEGGRLVLQVAEGSLVIDVKSARVAHHTSSMRKGDARSVIRLDCELVGTVVHKDTQDRTEAIILHGERDDPEAVVLVTRHLTDVNVSTNFPGSTEITIEALGLPIEYSKMVEKALQVKKKVPDSRILMPQFVLDKMQMSLLARGYITPTGQTLKSALTTMSGHNHSGVVTGSPVPSQTYTIKADQMPGYLVSAKVLDHVATDEEVLNDKED